MCNFGSMRSGGLKKDVQKAVNIDRIRAKAKAKYDALGIVRCPALSGKVHFTSEGFNHLRYAGKRERPINVQVMKLSLVGYINEILSITTTIQEHDERRELIHKKRYKKLSKEWSTIRYWGFVAIIRDKRIKVVVRQIDDGAFHFWSVIPAWKISRYQGHRVLNHAKGNLVED